MLVLSRRPTTYLAILLLAGATGLAMPLTAQDQKKDPDKKADVKKDDVKKDDVKKDDVKKDDVKKDDKKIDKKDDKKIDPKDVKKEEIKPDITKEKRDTPLQEFKGHNDWIRSLVVSDDGKLLLSASRDRTVKIWDISAGKELQTFKDNPNDTWAAVFLSADRVAGSTGKWNKEKNVWEGEIRIWDKNGKQDKSLKGHASEIQCLAVSKDGKVLASGSADHNIIVWDLQANKEIMKIRAHAGTIHGLAISPDGKTLASAGDDKTVRIWDLTPGKYPSPIDVKKEEPKKDDPKVDPKKEDPKKKSDPAKKEEPKEKLDTPVLEIKGPGREFTCVAFSPDGKSLAAGNAEGVVKIWDLPGNKEITELKTGEGVLSVAFSRDGSKVAAGSWDWAVRIFDAKTGKQLQIVNAHSYSVSALVFLEDGRLVSGGLDNLIKIWDLTKIQKNETKTETK